MYVGTICLCIYADILDNEYLRYSIYIFFTHIPLGFIVDISMIICSQWSLYTNFMGVDGDRREYYLYENHHG